MGAKPYIYQWNTEGSMIQKYRGVKKGVIALGVNNKYVAGVGMDDDHKIYLFQIDSGKRICEVKGGR